MAKATIFSYGASNMIFSKTKHVLVNALIKMNTKAKIKARNEPTVLFEIFD